MVVGLGVFASGSVLRLRFLIEREKLHANQEPEPAVLECSVTSLCSRVMELRIPARGLSVLTFNQWTPSTSFLSVFSSIFLQQSDRAEELLLGASASSLTTFFCFF